MKEKHKKRICEFAYSRAEIVGMSGDVTFCCPSYNEYNSLGNLNEQSFEEIWNGEKAQKIRQSMLDGSFKYCHTDICCANEELLIHAPKGCTTHAALPKIVELAPSTICNVRCIMCRDDYIQKHPSESDKNFYEKMLPKYLDAIKYAEKLNLNQCGEALADLNCKKLLKEALKINPNLKIGILSNGKLCNKETFEKYGILNNLYWVQVSIHAATKETYEKIVRDSDFETIKTNLQWLASEKKTGRIPRVTINFVVTSYNFREIPAFAKWAKELDVECEFWEVRQHPIDPSFPEEVPPFALQDKNFKDIAVFLPSHPDYEELIEILKNPILKEDFCNVNDFLANLKSQKSKNKTKQDKNKVNSPSKNHV